MRFDRSHAHHLITVVAILTASALLPSCVQDTDKLEIKSGPVHTTVPTKVDTCSPSTSSYAPGFTVPGLVVSLTKHKISSRIDGVAEAVLMHEGQKVKEGEMLLQLDTTHLEFQKALLLAQLSRAKLELQQAQNSKQEMLQQAERNLIKIDRLRQQQTHVRELYEHARQEYTHAQSLQEAGGISESALEEYRLKTEQHRTSLEQLKKQLQEALIGLRVRDLQQHFADKIPTYTQRKQAYLKVTARRADTYIHLNQTKIQELESKLNFHHTQLRACRVHAPRTGFLTHVETLPGDYLREGDAVATLVETQKLYIKTEIPASYRYKLSVGQKTEIHLQKPGMTVSGEVYRISPSTSPHNRSFTLISSITKKTTEVVPGTRVQIKICTQPAEVLFTIPPEALICEHISPNPQSYPCKGKVFVVRQNSAFLQPVHIVDSNSNSVFIKKGITDSDQIVLAPPSYLKEGMPVQKSIKEVTYE